MMEVKKPAWLKRKLIWPLKSNLLRSLPFKVSSFFCHPVQVFLVALGLGSYLTDVGLDADGMIRWLTMTGCHR